MTIREKGSYLARDGRLSFSRGSNEITTWPFRFEEDLLILEEGNEESHAYRRTKDLQCQSATAPS
jgi:hypothetical protein